MYVDPNDFDIDIPSWYHNTYLVALQNFSHYGVVADPIRMMNDPNLPNSYKEVLVNNYAQVTNPSLPLPVRLPYFRNFMRTYHSFLWNQRGSTDPNIRTIIANELGLEHEWEMRVRRMWSFWDSFNPDFFLRSLNDIFPFEKDELLGKMFEKPYGFYLYASGPFSSIVQRMYGNVKKKKFLRLPNQDAA